MPFLTRQKPHLGVPTPDASDKSSIAVLSRRLEIYNVASALRPIDTHRTIETAHTRGAPFVWATTRPPPSGIGLLRPAGPVRLGVGRICHRQTSAKGGHHALAGSSDRTLSPLHSRLG